MRRIKKILIIIKLYTIAIINILKDDRYSTWFIFLFMLVESFALTRQFKVEGISFKLLN